MRLLRFGLVRGLALVTLCLAGCKEPVPSAPDAAVAEAPAPAAPPPVAFALQYQAPDAGLVAVPLDPEAPPVLEPTQTLELRVTPGLRNYRVRLFDEADRAMVSDDVAEDSPEALVYRIQLPTPLKTGHKYTLVVDAQTGTTMADALGRDVEDLRAGFIIAGEKEKPPPPKPAGKKRRR